MKLVLASQSWEDLKIRFDLKVSIPSDVAVRKDFEKLPISPISSKRTSISSNHEQADQGNSQIRSTKPSLRSRANETLNATTEKTSVKESDIKERILKLPTLASSRSPVPTTKQNNKSHRLLIETKDSALLLPKIVTRSVRGYKSIKASGFES
mgnify:CR=1 FL=1